MNDSTTRKTLSLKKKAPAPRTETGEEPRKRSGARARQAALQEHARQTRPGAAPDERPQTDRPRATGPRKPRPVRDTGPADTDRPRVQRLPPPRASRCGPKRLTSSRPVRTASKRP